MCWRTEQISMQATKSQERDSILLRQGKGNTLFGNRHHAEAKKPSVEELLCPYLPKSIGRTSSSNGLLQWISTSSYNTLQPRRLEGKVAIITGGASGIGEASAKLFAREGAKIIIADIQDELGQSLASTLGDDAEYLHCDVTKESDISGAVDFAVSKHGRLDVMFNNAGTGGQMVVPVVQVDIKDFDKLMAVNLNGMLLGTKHAARVMIPAKKGSIICTSSAAALVSGSAPHPYTISKHAVIGLVKSVASELSQHGISVNSIAPYAITTPLLLKHFQQANPSLTEEYIAELVDRSSGFYGAKFRPEEIAKVAVFLASEEARYISGQTVAVDGAFTVTKAFNPFEGESFKSENSP